MYKVIFLVPEPKVFRVKIVKNLPVIKTKLETWNKNVLNTFLMDTKKKISEICRIT